MNSSNREKNHFESGFVIKNCLINKKFINYHKFFNENLQDAIFTLPKVFSNKSFDN